MLQFCLFILGTVNCRQQRCFHYLCLVMSSWSSGFHKYLNDYHFRLRNTLSKGKGTQVVFSRLKLHFMSQMSKWLIRSLGMNMILDNVSVPTKMLLLFTSSFIKSFLIAYCRKPCKIGYKYLEDGTKVRYARGMNASGAVIPRPEILKERKKPRPTSRMSHKKLFLQ